MSKVTLEGTETPSTFLKTGHRITVELTDFTRKLVRGGFVRIVAHLPTIDVPTEAAVGGEVHPTPPDPDRVPVMLSEGGPVEATPSRAASRETWQQFLNAWGIPYPAEATRNELIILWDNHG